MLNDGEWRTVECGELSPPGGTNILPRLAGGGDNSNVHFNFVLPWLLPAISPSKTYCSMVNPDLATPPPPLPLALSTTTAKMMSFERRSAMLHAMAAHKKSGAPSSCCWFELVSPYRLPNLAIAIRHCSSWQRPATAVITVRDHVGECKRIGHFQEAKEMPIHRPILLQAKAGSYCG